MEYYNIEMVTSVGYRAKSKRGVQFRQWANKVLKEYLLNGYSINQRLMSLENQIDRRLSEHDRQIEELSGKVDFFLRTSLPPREGILFDGQIFDAHQFVNQLVRAAKMTIMWMIRCWLSLTIVKMVLKPSYARSTSQLHFN